MKKLIVSILTVVIMLAVGVKILKADSLDTYILEHNTESSNVISANGLNYYDNSGCIHGDCDNNGICDSCGTCQNNVSTSNNTNNYSICGKNNCNYEYNSCYYRDSNNDGAGDNRHSQYRYHNRQY